MLLGMINDILDLAKIESGKMEVRSEDFSIRDVCEGLDEPHPADRRRKKITLECRLDEAIPLLRQDPGKVRQILYNLLSNAIKFTPEGGRVTLRRRAEGRFVVLEVEDTGIGIAEEDRETIFEKFRQAKAPGQEDNVLTREHQGTGLGLSIVRELAKLLGGDVSLAEPARAGEHVHDPDTASASGEPEVRGQPFRRADRPLQGPSDRAAAVVPPPASVEAAARRRPARRRPQPREERAGRLKACSSVSSSFELT